MQKFDDFAFRRSFAGIADCLAATITPNGRIPFVVAIDGPGCCGKSTLTDLLLERLDAVSIGTDDFHEHEGFCREPDAPLPYRRWTDLRNAIGSLSRGVATTIQSIDWSDHSLGPPRTIEPASAPGAIGQKSARMVRSVAYEACLVNGFLMPGRYRPT